LPKQHGFTLVELMVVLAIMAAMMAMAVPSFQNTIDQNRLTGKSAELANAIRTARTEAMKRGAGARVTVAPVTSSTWTSGWKVFVDTTTNANGGAAPTSGSTILLATEALPSQVTQDTAKTTLGYVSFIGTGNAMVTSSDASATGFVKTTGGYQSGTIQLAVGTQKRCIKLVQPGLVDVSSAAC
jgi:type IV fimbrial biogenesis protein FimT